MSRHESHEAEEIEPPWTSQEEFEASLTLAGEQIAAGDTVNLGDFTQFAEDDLEDDGTYWAEGESGNNPKAAK